MKMKKKKIKVATILGIKKVLASEIKVSSAKKLRFFFHPSVYRSGYSPSEFDEDRFTITEFKSGICICRDKSKSACIAKLKERLRQHKESWFIDTAKSILSGYKIKFPLN